MSAAATSISGANRNNTAARPLETTSNDVRSGPTIVPSPSTVPDTELAAVSSDVEADRSGRRALWTGRVSVIAHEERIAVAYTTIGGPNARASPHASAAPAWIA